MPVPGEPSLRGSANSLRRALILHKYLRLLVFLVRSELTKGVHKREFRIVRATRGPSGGLKGSQADPGRRSGRVQASLRWPMMERLLSRKRGCAI